MGLRRYSAFDLAVALLAAAGLIGALFASSARLRSEARNRRVGIAVDYAEVERLASAMGTPAGAVLDRLRKSGVTSVAVTEDTVLDLVDKGLASLAGSERVTTVRLAGPDLLDRVGRAWQARGVKAAPSIEADGGPYTLLWCDQGIQRSLLFHGAYAALRSLGSGLPERGLNDARGAGLGVVARVSNFAGASADTIGRVLAEVRDAGADLVICTGMEVLGYQGLHREAAEAYKRTGVLYGQIEFGKQKGDAALASALRGEFVRVHSISEGEMGTLSEGMAIERFVRAARERNIRLCYVRMVTFAGADPVAANGRYVAAIVSGMARGGLLRPGPARPFDNRVPPITAFLLIGLGVGALSAKLLIRLTPGSTGFPLKANEHARRWLLLLILCAACGVLGVLGETGRRLLALAAAIVAPTLACIGLVGITDSQPPDRKTAPHAGAALLAACRMLLSASSVTFLGIAAVVGLLASRPYMVKASQFLGIKAAHALPIAIVALLLVIGLPAAGRSAAEDRRLMAERARKYIGQPALVGTLALAALVLVALMLAVLRTGNDPGVGVSGMEMTARSVLDSVLPVRPRTKEFLIGHPAFVLAVVLALSNRRRWAPLAAVLGVLGQVSLLNTFCHIHTPLIVSLARGVTGLTLGAALGAAISFVLFGRKGADGPKPSVADGPVRSEASGSAPSQ